MGLRFLICKLSVLTPTFQSFIKDTHTHTHTHTQPGTLSLIIVLNLTAITSGSVVIKNLRIVKLI